MTDYILQTKGITKTYVKDKVLDKINMNIKRGTIYGLIGRNGAGKTTLLKVIGGLSFPTEGEVLLFGEKINENNKLLERVGVLIENPGLYPNLTSYENMKLKCIAYGMDKKEYIESLLEQVGLGNVGEKKIKQFSLGMKQRLGIALALVGEPDLLLLDEPVNGLDPQGIIEIREILTRLSIEKNMTIVISSHILEELSKIVSRIGIIEDGKLIEELNQEELLEKTKDKLEISTENIEGAVTILEEKFDIKDYKVVDNKTLYIYEKLNESGDINKALVNGHIKVDSIFINQESLEDYFINLTGGGKNV